MGIINKKEDTKLLVLEQNWRCVFYYAPKDQILAPFKPVSSNEP